MSQTDYYRVLGVDETATPQQIKEAYRKLAFQYHPDRQGQHADNAENMKAINEAYAVLSNGKKRREYDAIRHQFGSAAADEFRKSFSEQDIFSGSDIRKIFEEMATSFGLQGFDDIFKEFYGKEYHSFRVQKPGFFMGGFIFSGRFGTASPGNQHLLSGKGLGKLPRLIFQQLTGLKPPQQGADRVNTITLSATQAAEGGPYAYYHRKQAKKIIVKIPPAVRHGQKIRLQGLGDPGKAGGTPGDLYLKIRIKQPLSQKIKAVIEDFRNR